jgi:very-short-patch-repair endonuclease/predicted transcriptional regulator of viral defense system
MARIHAAIAERAGQQLGLIRRVDLDELGVTSKQTRSCTDSGVLIREGRGVLRHAGFERTYHQRLLNAAWTAGDGAVISHMAAASLWSFDGIQPGAVEVSVPWPRNPRLVVGRVHRIRDLGPADVTTRGLIPVTTPARTLLDCAARLQLPQIEEALDGACRRNQIDLRFLEWRLESLRRRGRPGVAALAALLQPGRSHGEESWLESAFLRLLRDAGLPLPRIQVAVVAGPGGKRYRLDGTYDEHDLVVEVDGHATHATRRQRQADAERDARLLAAGRRVVRFTYEDVVERPHYVTSTIATLIGWPVPGAVIL